MYVCLCNALTDRQLRQHLERGVRSVSMLYRACGTEPQCGKCVLLVRQMHREGAGGVSTSGQRGGEDAIPAVSPAHNRRVRRIVETGYAGRSYRVQAVDRRR